jgi:hypothetical protein
MADAGTFIRFAMQSAETNIDYVYRPSRHDLWAALDAWEREAKERRMFAWKEPRKRITVPTVKIMRKYENRFTGCKFPIGGPKK